MTFNQTILSAAKREDIILHFQNLTSSTSSSTQFLFPSGVSVELQKSRPNPIVPIIIHTPIIFSGRKEFVDKVVVDFRREFLTAGG